MFKRKSNKDLINKYSGWIGDYQNDSVITDIIVNINTVRACLERIKEEAKSKWSISDSRWIFLSLKLADLNEQYLNEIRKLESEYLTLTLIIVGNPVRHHG